MDAQTPLATIIDHIYREARKVNKDMTSEELTKLVEEMGPLPTEMGPTTAEVARARVADLEAAIKNVLSQQMDHICWMDVYTTLGKLVGVDFDPLKLPKHIFDSNCERFSLALYAAKPYDPDKLTQYFDTMMVIADEHRQAKMLLQMAGYGSVDTPLLECLRSALEQLEKINEDQ